MARVIKHYTSVTQDLDKGWTQAHTHLVKAMSENG